MTTAQKRAQTITTTVGGTFNLPNNTVPATQTTFDGHAASKNQNVYGGVGPFKVLFGTGHQNNVYFTAGNQAGTTVTGLAGNDSMFLRNGAYGTYTVNMGTGQNTISLDDNFGKVIYTTSNAAASTYDTLDMSNTTNALAANLVLTSAAVTLTKSGSFAADSTIADVHSMRAINLGAGTATITLNNLDDTVTFGNGSATVTASAGTAATPTAAATYGDDTYVFKNFTGTTNSTVTINDIGGNNAMDFSQTTSNVSLTIGANSVTGQINGTGAGAGHTQSISVAGVGSPAVGGYINGIQGGAGNDTFTVGNSAGVHSINGGTGVNTLVYTGSQGVTLDARDHEMSNIAATTDITFHGFNNYKLLGAGTNTFIGDGTSGNTIWAGNGNTVIDGGVGSAITVHSDMGGNTTLILGDNYGASTVSNTAGNGVLTVDASALTHAVTAALGVGTGAAQINDSGATTTSSVTWAANSTVTGYIGNDMDTTIAGTGAYNFHITTGAGNDTITAGNGANVISTGNGNDSVTVGTGSNTVIFGNGNDTVTASAGAGNNSIFTGGGTGTESLGATSTGIDIVDYSNGGTHTTVMGTGDNVIQGFSANNTWSVDMTNHGGAATKGTLDLSSFNKADVKYDDHVLNGSSKVQDLVISTDANHTITIHNFFDGTHATAATSTIGTGGFDNIKFADGTLHFSDVSGFATAAGTWV